MQPQEKEILNSEYFRNLKDTIRNCQDPNELQDLVDNASEDLNVHLDAINSQIESIAPVMALLKVPGDPIAAVTWIGKFISGFLTPYTKPYMNYISQLSGMQSQISDLHSVMNDAADKLNTTISIPDVKQIAFDKVTSEAIG